ncbi:hypothetical protein ALP8811_02484 [Aliiroseovarius pelagivivens]|uniref:Uncharacterized protein n=2 Tax=Aliiroseovarius pelagivivens TaxID=1639690 RepID=A0A2R8AR50_9RHOB|nr:hypothetical protein ALP8811_02484 [Aliiroseovarius pelagivivens]
MGIQSKAIAAAIGIACATSAAQAEGYWGVALDVSKATSEVPSFGNYEHDKIVPGIAVVLGNRINSGNFFYGYEASASITLNGDFDECSGFNPAPALCKQAANLRVVGVVGQQMGEYDVYGKLGYGAVFGDFAVSPFSVDSGNVKGLTIGLGTSRQLNDATKLFGEVIYDAYRNSGGQPGGYVSNYDSINLRLGVMRSF